MDYIAHIIETFSMAFYMFTTTNYIYKMNATRSSGCGIQTGILIAIWGEVFFSFFFFSELTN